MTIAIGIRFPAGRYHATPWERHVNEAEVEWPPSPWRVLRALTAVWHRKADRDRHAQETLDALLEALAAVLPVYRLPRATHAHTRHYMPVRDGRRERKTLIFDAFASVDRDDELVMAWPDASLDASEVDLLEELLRKLGYLGRAESWVEARLLEAWDGEPNCTPFDGPDDTSAVEHERVVEPVTVAVPVPPGEYQRWRDQAVDDYGLDEEQLNVTQRRLLATLPDRLIGALHLDTADVRRAGWSRPPGVDFVTYRRPYDCFAPDRGPLVMRGVAEDSRFTTVRLALSGKPLPRIEDAIKIGEIVRAAAIHHADGLDDAGEVPPELSGHGMPDDNRHEHAFYLPEDADGDGLIDHVLVHANAGLSQRSLAALDRIRRIWKHDGVEWRVVLDTYGDSTDFVDHIYLEPARTWVSVTPYLHPWYRKAGFTIEDQIRRECRARGLPEPSLERSRTVRIRDRDRRPVHFHRFRNRRGLTQPDTHGSFWTLTFPKPVPGPIALGFGCHFGLGMFRSRP